MTVADGRSYSKVRSRPVKSFAPGEDFHPLQVALKEWAVVIEALAQAEQIFVLRKGGIAEGSRGFELRHKRFWLFPAWEHQHREALQPSWQARFDAVEPPDASHIELRYFAEVHDIVRAPTDVEAFLRVSDAHVWTASFFEQRLGYRPDLPLYAVALRVYVLPGAVRIANEGRYKGCVSWVDLKKTFRPKARSLRSVRALSCKPGWLCATASA